MFHNLREIAFWLQVFFECWGYFCGECWRTELLKHKRQIGSFSSRHQRCCFPNPQAGHDLCVLVFQRTINVISDWWVVLKSPTPTHKTACQFLHRCLYISTAAAAWMLSLALLVMLCEATKAMCSIISRGTPRPNHTVFGPAASATTRGKDALYPPPSTPIGRISQAYANTLKCILSSGPHWYYLLLLLFLDGHRCSQFTPLCNLIKFFQAVWWLVFKSCGRLCVCEHGHRPINLLLLLSKSMKTFLSALDSHSQQLKNV